MRLDTIPYETIKSLGYELRVDLFAPKMKLTMLKGEVPFSIELSQIEFQKATVTQFSEQLAYMIRRVENEVRTRSDRVP